jgi:nucleotide-binding universal stress UspA family protein
MYKAILYPTDGSSTARAALEHARNQAEKHDATVHVLYVIGMEHAGVGLTGDLDIESSPGMVGTPTESGPGMIGTRGSVEIEDLESEAADIVGHVAEQFEDVETQTAVRAGSAYETILEYVDDDGLDMIVMSTHGRSGLDRYVIGSVTEKAVSSPTFQC